MLYLRDSPCCSTLRVLGNIIAKIAKIPSYLRIHTDAPTRTKFQWFTSNLPLVSFKKSIVLTPRLLHSLHAMSLTKAVPDGLKDCECKRITLRERPLVPHVPEKDFVQETVSDLKNNQSLKTLIGEGADYVSPSGTAGRATPLLCPCWDWLGTGLRNEDTSRPAKKPMSTTWSNATWLSR